MEYIKKWLTYWYFRYELATNLYVFEPWEKKMLNALIIGTTGMVIYSSWVYLPPYLRSMMTTLQTSTETTIEPS